MNLILVSKEEAAAGRLPEKDARTLHIRQILKPKSGDTVAMGIVNESKGRAVIESAEHNGKVVFTYTAEQQAEQPYPLTLVLGAARPLVMRRLLRDMTAAGCQQIFIYTAENGERGYQQSSLWKNEDYMKAVYEGLSLAKCVTAPHVKRFLNLREALNAQKAACVVAMDAAAGRSFKECPPLNGSVSLVVGNERGFTNNELITLKFFNTNIYNMGPRIVRTETACAMAVALTLNNFC
jgi:16S rRNA (uracil1498-N3)-methyltransferase